MEADAVGIREVLPTLHFGLEMGLNRVAVGAVVRHEIEDDHVTSKVAHREPAGLVGEAVLDARTVERFEDDLRDRFGLGVRLEERVEAAEQRERGVGDGPEQDHGDAERFPRLGALEGAPVRLVKHTHANPSVSGR